MRSALRHLPEWCRSLCGAKPEAKLKTVKNVISTAKDYIVHCVSAFIKGPTMVGKKGPTIWSL